MPLPSDAEGLKKLSEQAQSTGQIEDFSNIPKELLNNIYTFIIKSVRDGVFVTWHHFGKPTIFSIGLSSVPLDVATDIMASNYRYTDMVKIMLEHSIVGMNHSYFDDAERTSILTKLLDVSSVINNTLMMKLYKIQETFAALVRFIPPFCHSTTSRSLWVWYQNNSSRRPFLGANDLEAYWSYINDRMDRDSNFVLFRFMASAWSKGASKIKTQTEKGFAITADQKGAGHKTSAQLEEEVVKELTGQDDDHMRAVKAYEADLQKKKDTMMKELERRKKENPAGISSEIKLY